MAKKKQHQSGRSGKANPPPISPKRWLWIVVAIIVTAAGVTALVRQGIKHPEKPDGPTVATKAGASSNTQGSNAVGTTLPTLEINQAVMVTVELDFGPKVPSIAEALREIERRSQPEDGVGRTFAILDAYGQPTPAGKLHLSMHVSSEKLGLGSLVFRRTGEVLWQSRIVPSTNATPFSGKNLMIYVANGAGGMLTVDGSSNPSSILTASVKELGAPVETIWPDGAEREMTYIYSACGCPVKVMAKRVGDRTVRTKELPVIFPDDPAVAEMIAQLMRW